jgi:citrate synthase
MDKVFCLMQHDDTARKDLFQVMEFFSKIKDADGEVTRSYDPAYMNTVSCISKISYIDGDKGILEYRGYPIE